MFDTRALIVATVVGTVLQVAMVIIGHTNPAVAALFAAGGMLISLLAGAAYVAFARGSGSAPVFGATIAGAVGALIGIAVSWQLGDVPASLLALGTASSAVTGAIGGWIARRFVPAVRTAPVNAG